MGRASVASSALRFLRKAVGLGRVRSGLGLRRCENGRLKMTRCRSNPQAFDGLVPFESVISRQHLHPGLDPVVQ